MLLPNETKYQSGKAKQCKYSDIITIVGVLLELGREYSSLLTPVGPQVLLGQLHHSLKPLPKSEHTTRKNLLQDQFII